MKFRFPFAAVISLLALTFTCSPTLSAKIVTKPISYEHNGAQLEGYLAYDDTKTSGAKLPGVLVIPEWWGLNDYVKGRARQLAELGYVAFAADMYGAGIVTSDPKKAGELAGQFYGKPLFAERSRAALDQLLAQPSVDSSRVASIGYCFGGAASQALAYAGAPLAGIVSFHGSLLAATPEASAKNKAKFLILHGAVDPFISKAELDGFLESMNTGNFDYQFIAYADAVHAFTNPGADEIAAKGLNGVGYNAAADRRSWQHMQSFFAEIFKK